MSRTGFEGERAWISEQVHDTSRPLALMNEVLGSCGIVVDVWGKEETVLWPGTMPEFLR